MAVAIFLLVIVVGSVLFTFFSPWRFSEIASNWGGIDLTVLITFWVCGVVFVAVGGFMAYCSWKYRHREGARADYEPENARLEWWLTAVTTVGVVAMLAPGLIVWNDYVNPPDEALEFEVLSQQWTWKFRFPGEDGVLGTVDVANVSLENPFGMRADDPAGEDDVLVNDREVHLPIDQPFKVLLRSRDVLHDFFVPEFRAKMDSVPGMVTYFWFTPTRIGSYEIICAELCGASHHSMRGWVHVDSQEQFNAWLAGQPTWAEMRDGVVRKVYSAQAQRGRQVAEANGCLACHTLDGTQMVGPTWQAVWGSTRALADGTEATVDEAYVVESVRDPNAKVVAGFGAGTMIAYGPDVVSDEDLAALVAFLKEDAAQ